MNWYVNKIFELISENQCDYDGFCIFLDLSAWFTEDTQSIVIEVTDCADNTYQKRYSLDYRQFIKEPNYLKRDYSDKLLAYTCNLLELYDKYIFKSQDYVMINIHMQGDKCFGGRGFIDWN